MIKITPVSERRSWFQFPRLCDSSPELQTTSAYPAQLYGLMGLSWQLLLLPWAVPGLLMLMWSAGASARHRGPLFRELCRL